MIDETEEVPVNAKYLKNLMAWKLTCKVLVASLCLWGIVQAPGVVFYLRSQIHKQPEKPVTLTIKIASPKEPEMTADEEFAALEYCHVRKMHCATFDTYPRWKENWRNKLPDVKARKTAWEKAYSPAVRQRAIHLIRTGQVKHDEGY